MPKPLRIFLEQPFNQWQVAAAYGPAPDGEFNAHAILSSNGNARVLAPAAGRLTVRSPLYWGAEPDRPLQPPDETTPLPAVTLVYLQPAFGALLGANNAFRQALAATEFSGVSSFGFIVETASLQTAIAAPLAAVPLGATTPPTPGQLFRLFLNGSIDVNVMAGSVLGQARPGTGGTRQLSAGVHFDLGSIDPSYFYDQMRDFVEDGSEAVDALLQVMPSNWPVVGATTKEVLLLETAAGLYPYSTLTDAKRRLGLTRAEWRTVGDNQKALYRRRLLARVGHAPAGATDPHFTFNDFDWQNIFQLEAVVEFFMNFREPWDPTPGNVPRDPATNPATPAIPDIGPRDFLDLSGTNATAAGNVVTLNDAGVPVDRIRSNAVRGDVIVLDTDTARRSRTYRITGRAGAALTLAGAPNLAGAPSAWKIKSRPNIVVIDPFGPRISGTTATIIGVSPAGHATVRLERAVEKVNRFFDTIYFPADTATARRAYRILRANNDELLVEGNPNFGAGGSSDWQIQSGLGGAFTGGLPGARALPYDLGPEGARPQWDHFDGMLFLIYDDEVRMKARWNSYTSRQYADNHPEQFNSSIDGNRGFDFRTFRATNNFRNYVLQVVDMGSNIALDLCANARFFFRPHARYPGSAAAPAHVNRDGDGKDEIRLHHSRDRGAGGCNSAGCVVSWLMWNLRTQIAQIIQAEHRATRNAGVPDLNTDNLINATQDDISQPPPGGGQSMWQADLASDWAQRLVGRFWLVRPDQLPLLYQPPAGL